MEIPVARRVCFEFQSELIGLSSGLRVAIIPLLNVPQEMKDRGFDILPCDPKIKCKAFQDNNGSLAIATMPRMRPRTKHINTNHFNFVECTSREDFPLDLERMDAEDMPADFLTKPLALDPFLKHRKWTLGW